MRRGQALQMGWRRGGSSLQMSEDIERTLGRLEGKVDQLLSEQALVRAELADHKGEDRNSFAIVSARFGSVATRLDDQNEKLDTLNGYVSQVKGAWWLIGALVVVVASCGAAVTWVVSLWPRK